MLEQFSTKNNINLGLALLDSTNLHIEAPLGGFDIAVRPPVVDFIKFSSLSANTAGVETAPVGKIFQVTTSTPEGQSKKTTK